MLLEHMFMNHWLISMQRPRNSLFHCILVNKNDGLFLFTSENGVVWNRMLFCSYQILFIHFISCVVAKFHQKLMVVYLFARWECKRKTEPKIKKRERENNLTSLNRLEMSIINNVNAVEIKTPRLRMVKMYTIYKMNVEVRFCWFYFFFVFI